MKNLLNSVLKLRNLFLLFSVLIITTSAFSQEEEEDFEFVGLKKEKKKKNTEKTEKTIDFDLLDEEFSTVKFKLSLFMPSLGVEFKLSDNFSLEISGKMNFLLGISGTTSSPKIQAIPMPVFHLEPKWNYNVKKRIQKGKKISGFSSNFISIFASYRIPVQEPYTIAHNLVIGPTWGLQRQLGKYGYLKFNAGLGYLHYFDSGFRKQVARSSNIPISIAPIVDFQIGFMF